MAAKILISKCLKNQADRAARPAVLVDSTNEKGNMTMGDPVRLINYYAGRTRAGDRIPNTFPLPYQNQPMIAPQPNESQLMSPQFMYSAGAGNMPRGARSDTMFSDAPMMSTCAGSLHQPNMRQGSEFDGSSNSG